MIISRTPFRISFFGGGSDYPGHYNHHGGAVLAATINRFCYISIRSLPPFFDYRYRVVYSKSEHVRDIGQINHPSVRECLRYMEIDEGLEIHHDGDVPARGGLGSSSSFTVGLLHALNAYKGRMISKRDLAEAAIHVEQNMIQEHVGSQDQTMAAFGGVNLVRFDCPTRQHLLVTPLCIQRERMEALEKRLMLFFTGILRTASDVAKHQIAAIDSKREELATMTAMVDEAAHILNNGSDIADFGRLLNESWAIKRCLTDKITSPVIDDIYAKGLRSGACGGKLLGAGGGGYILFFVDPERRQEMKDSLGLVHVPFKFESQGSQIIFYEPNSQ